MATTQKDKQSKLAIIVVAVMLAVAAGIVLFLTLNTKPGEEEQAQPTPGIVQPSAKPTTAPAPTDTAPPADPDNEPPPEEAAGVTDKPAFVDGVPYYQTEEAQKVWFPRRATFIKAILGDKPVLPQVKGIVSGDVAKSLEKVEPGQYKDELKIEGDEEEDWYEEPASAPFFFTQVFQLQSGKTLSVTMEYVFDGKKGEWLVTGYAVK